MAREKTGAAAGGILLITTDSDSVYQQEMPAGEKRKYETKGVVVRGQYEEGKKMYLTRHSPAYLREKLLRRFELLEHVPVGFAFMKQDYWVARKKQTPAETLPDQKSLLRRTGDNKGH